MLTIPMLSVKMGSVQFTTTNRWLESTTLVVFGQYTTTGDVLSTEVVNQKSEIRKCFIQHLV